MQSRVMHPLNPKTVREIAPVEISVFFQKLKIKRKSNLCSCWGWRPAIKVFSQIWLHFREESQKVFRTVIFRSLRLVIEF
jgi:hypothetical protein